MVMHTRYVYRVSTRRDPVPGFNHEPEDMRRAIERFMEAVGHYHPIVEFIEEVEEDVPTNT